ncbi:MULTISPECIES: hypothetical protein [unclassified Parabacteroides]|uniref:hypothetical protein n=1 Tax=unclassified Parabacteroides TaxID=2649774 RepID=UPI00247372CD|nr:MULTISPECIES: hypothetical protein [unclassified Parabacteroides]
MITKYPPTYDIYEVLSAQTRAFINKFAQSRGLILTNASKDDLVKELSSLLYELSDLEEIREASYQTSNKQSLSGFTIKPKDTDFDLESLYNRLREYGQLQSKGYQLKTLSREKRSEEIVCCKGEIEYTKHKSGKIEFLQGEKYNTEFFFFNLPDGSWQVEVDGSSSSDGKEVLKLMQMVIGAKSAEIATLKIDDLQEQDVITFFDRLAKEGFDKKEWALLDIKQLTFKRRGNVLEIEEEGEEETLEEVSEKDLGGISQAVLDGRNLREHSFVRQAENSGCVFTAMTYEFKSIRTSALLIIKAEFKGSPKIFEVSVINTGNIEGTKGNKKVYYAPTTSFKREKASEFWNNARKVYNSLLK